MQLDFFAKPVTWRSKPIPPVPRNCIIGVDTETHDPDLLTDGPGWRTKKAHIIGVSVSFDGYKSYWPVRHAHDNAHSCAEVFDWVAEAFAPENNNTLVFANAAYDIGNLSNENIPPPEKCTDICILDNLIEQEHPDGASLNALAWRYLKRRKNESELETFVRNQGWKGSPKSHMRRIPGNIVGPYAEDDAELARLVYLEQLKELGAQSLMDMHDLENELIPIVHRMVKQGIEVDADYTGALNEKWGRVEAELLAKVGARPGQIGREDVYSADFVSTEFRRRGIERFLGTTKTGKISVRKAALETAAKHDPFAAALLEARVLVKIRRDYLQGALLGQQTRGKVHPEFIQRARGGDDEDDESNGTRTGRFASKNPNIQQIPKRASFASFKAKDMRPCLHVSDGQWAKFDYNSQEPRMQVHYGLIMGLSGAAEVAAGFEKGIKLYKTITDLLPEVSYDDSKIIVLGRSYGMGAAKLAKQLGITEDEAEEILRKFDRGVGYIGLGAERVNAKAAQRGYIIGVNGQRRHFNWWEPDQYNHPDKGQRIFGYEAARERWPKIKLKRCDTRKAYNSLIQGGCGVQTKFAIRDAWRAEKLVPLMTVHDEVSWRVNDEAMALRCKRYMEDAIKLRLPTKSDMDLGTAWC